MPPKTPFEVQATKKGALPVAVEKRPKGKIVTVVKNVRGSAQALLTGLKVAAGAGGCEHGSYIELQGDHARMVELFLVRSGCVKGMSKANDPTARQETVLTGPIAEQTQRIKHPPKASEPAADVSLNYAPREWIKQEREDSDKATFGRLMRAWPYWNQQYARLPGLYADFVLNRGKEACQELDDEGGLSSIAQPCAPALQRPEAAEAGGWSSLNDPTWEHRLRAAGLVSERCVEGSTRADRARQARREEASKSVRLGSNKSAVLDARRANPNSQVKQVPKKKPTKGAQRATGGMYQSSRKGPVDCFSDDDDYVWDSVSDGEEEGEGSAWGQASALHPPARAFECVSLDPQRRQHHGEQVWDAALQRAMGQMEHPQHTRQDGPWGAERDQLGMPVMRGDAHWPSLEYGHPYQSSAEPAPKKNNIKAQGGAAVERDAAVRAAEEASLEEAVEASKAVARSVQAQEEEEEAAVLVAMHESTQVHNSDCEEELLRRALEASLREERLLPHVAGESMYGDLSEEEAVQLAMRWSQEEAVHQSEFDDLAKEAAVLRSLQASTSACWFPPLAASNGPFYAISAADSRLGTGGGYEDSLGGGSTRCSSNATRNELDKSAAASSRLPEAETHPVFSVARDYSQGGTEAAGTSGKDMLATVLQRSRREVKALRPQSTLGLQQLDEDEALRVALELSAQAAPGTGYVQEEWGPECSLWCELAEFTEAGLRKLSPELGDWPLVEFVLSIQDDAEAAGYLVDYLGDVAVEFATEFVHRRAELRSRCTDAQVRPPTKAVIKTESITQRYNIPSIKHEDTSSSSSRRSRKKGKGKMLLDPSYTNFNIPKGE